MYCHANAFMNGTGVASRAFAASSPAVQAASMSKCWLPLHVDIDAKTGPGTRRLGELSP